jgi:hypothetical protein
VKQFSQIGKIVKIITRSKNMQVAKHFTEQKNNHYMTKHHGQIIEKIIRRDGHSISNVARNMDVNRRTVYNWFNQAVLRQEIIYKIGHGIMHDFSVEFPELFKPEDFVFKNKPTLSAEDSKMIAETADDADWRGKYIELSERYNKLLREILKSGQKGTSEKP